METENKEAVFSETISENKRRRGRPTVFQRDHMEDFDRFISGIYEGKTRRTHVAEYYRSSVFGILEDHNEIISWSKLYDGATIEAKKMIVNSMIKQIKVFRDYKLEIEFNFDIRQFFIGIDDQTALDLSA